MSQVPADNNVISQEPPVYTENAPLIWIDLSIQGRWFKHLPWSGYADETVPISPQLYAALHKVSCLVASRLAEPDVQQGLSESNDKWDGLSSLLLYVTSFIFNINHGTSFFPRLSLTRVSGLIMKNWMDILSLCIREMTRDMDSMDAIITVWRLECALSKCDIPFYSGSTIF